MSTEDQAERETIQNQINVANAICPALGMSIVDSYLDDGVSGTIPLEERPEGVRLLHDAGTGAFEMVVAYRLDRVGRKALVILSAYEVLKKRGVGLRSLTEPFDTSQPFGEFVMGILAMVAGYERDSIISRTMEGRRRKAREDKWTGGHGSPLGYKVVDGYLEVDEGEAPLVRRIFSMYIEERMSAFSLATYLNANGVQTQSARRGFTSKKAIDPGHWDHSRVLGILKNETYAGVRWVGKREKVETPDGPKWRMRQGKEGFIRQEVPAIVSRETWEEAQRLMKQNWANAPRNAKRDYLLRGLIFCGLCGRRYTGYTTNSGQGAYYKCNDRECNQHHGSPIVRAELLETMVWEEIKGFVHNPGPILAELEEQAGLLVGTGLKDEIQQAEKALARILDERQTILFRLRKRLVSDDEGDNQLIATGHEKSMLEARLETLKAQVQNEEWQRTRLEGAGALLERLKERVESADSKTKREVIEILVKEITVKVGQAGPDISVAYLFETRNRIGDGLWIPRTTSWGPARST